MPEFQKRQTAFIIGIKDIIKGSYVKEEGWQPNYIKTGDKKISRANIIATVISKPEEEPFKTIVVDDGARISVRSFEEKNIFKDLEIGDIILIIGRPREYAEQKYIMPEVIKKVDEKWAELRKLQLQKMESEETAQAEEIKEGGKEEREVKEKQETSSEEKVMDTKMQQVFEIVKELDKGDGADFEEVMSKSNTQNPEKIIRALLEQGEIFELRPGKLKVLE
jgi:RPA family protein